MGDRHDHRAVILAARRRVLWLALAANAAFMGVELAGGLVFGSLALLADAAHMLSDVVGLGLAILAQRLLERPPTAKHSYGLQRAEVLGAQANGIILIGVAGWVFYEALQRLSDPPEVAGGGLLAVAAVGLAVNLASAIALGRRAGLSLNMRGAVLHMGADAAGSVAAMVAGVAILAWRAEWIDPAVSIGIGVLVIWSAWRLVRETVHVLLEGTPRHLNAQEVEAFIAADPAVEGVHHLHLWNLASDVPALSAHVVLRENLTLHQAQIEGGRLRDGLHARFAIDHSTLELECHDCEEPSHHQLSRES